MWSIRSSVYIVITTNNAFLHSYIPDAKRLRVEKFDGALEFLQEIRDDDLLGNSRDDLLELCEHIGWNVLGLTVAR